MLCSFCNTDRDPVAKGPWATICGSCLEATGVERDLPGLPCSSSGKLARRSRFKTKHRQMVGVSPSGDARICTICVPIARRLISGT